MANIYRNAFCRLAVTASKRPTESFWPPKPIVSSVRVPNLQDEDDFEGVVREMYMTLPKSYHDDVERGPLNRRGWVLQEKLLSPQTIHFTKDHIHYESDDTIVGEDEISRTFTWLSCIDKSSETARMNLFPEYRTFKRGNYDAMGSGEDAWLDSLIQQIHW